jgi:outer membrane protein assembly factor BamD (BamD/ComL family)
MDGILTPEEKAYCRGLEALRKKDYAVADKEFKACAKLHGDSRGFNIIAQAAGLMAVLQQEKVKISKLENHIRETAENGEETVVCRQISEESAG